MSEITSAIKEWGFPIAVSLYLLWERQTTFKASDDKWKQVMDLVVEVVKQNTATYTRLEGTIQKLCELMNGGKHDGSG